MKTNVTLRLFESENSSTKAFIELKLDNTLIVKGLSLVMGKRGLFLAYPAAKGKDGKYYNTVYSIDKDWKEKLEVTCIKKYEEAKKAADKVKKAADNTTEEDFT